MCEPYIDRPTIDSRNVYNMDETGVTLSGPPSSKIRIMMGLGEPA